MKLSRRSFCACAVGASLVARPAFGATDGCEVFTPERQSAMTPGEAIERLKEGNLRFVEGTPVNCDLMSQVHQTAGGQSPIAAIVGCIDSRVPPELVFDQRIGDVFCARIAGNFINADILGSLEYATKVAGAKAVVILGHTSCGAIKSAMAGVKMGNITGMLDNIRPALDAVIAAGQPDASDPVQVRNVAEANVRLAMSAVTERSPLMRELVDAGELEVAGAIHDVATGRVGWLA